MKESGLTEYWRKKHWPSLRQCNQAFRKFGPRSLTLDDIPTERVFYLGTWSWPSFDFVRYRIFGILYF